MKIFRISTMLALVMAVGSGAMLLMVSQDVQQAERELQQLTQASGKEEQTIRVLRAEWDYLNRPDWLEALAGQYLTDLMPPSAERLTGNAEMLPDPFIPVLPSHKPFHQPVKAQTITFTKPAISSSKATSLVTPSTKPRPVAKPSPSSSHNFQKLLGSLTEQEERP